MKKFEKLRWFLAGITVSALCVSFIVPAVAAVSGKNITIYPGVTLYMNDKKFTATDSDGNAVDAFVYNGTTYLPVRAVSKLLDVPVQWEGSTRSVYLGTHASETPAAYLEDLEPFIGIDLDTLTKTDNVGNEHIRTITYGYPYKINNTYLLNGNYTAITGVLFQTQEMRNSKTESTLKIYGDEKLLYQSSVSAGVLPIDFDVDLTGILKLRIEFNGGSSLSSDFAAIADCSLWT